MEDKITDLEGKVEEMSSSSKENVHSKRKRKRSKKTSMNHEFLGTMKGRSIHIVCIEGRGKTQVKDTANIFNEIKEEKLTKS